MFFNRLSAGVFENYLERGGSSGGLGGAVQALEWFIANDHISTQIASTQNYSLYPYLPYAFLCWHFLFARLNWTNIKYPKTGFEVCKSQVLFLFLIFSCFASTLVSCLFLFQHIFMLYLFLFLKSKFLSPKILALWLWRFAQIFLSGIFKCIYVHIYRSPLRSFQISI